MPTPQHPIIPGFESTRYDESQLPQPAAPYAPPTFKPLSRTRPLSPRSTRDLPASTVSGQSIEVVRGAIDQQARGFFQQLADLAQYMKRDSAFSAAMEKRVLGLLRNDFRFVPASDSARDVAVCNAVKRFWGRMAPEAELRLFVQWFHLLDLSVAAIRWDRWEFDADRVWTLPRLEARNMRWFYWDVSRSCFMDINADGVTAVDPVGGRYVVANVWRYGSFGGKAATLGEDWIEKVFARRDWAEWSDFYAWPAWKATVPAGGLGDDAVTQTFVEGLQQNARNRTIVVERGTDGNNTYDAEPIMMGDSWQGFPERIAMLDRKIQVAWLGGNLSSEVSDQGARAASQTQQSAETRLIQSDSVLLSQVLRDSLVRAFVTMNFGDDVPCPDVGWEVGVEEDLSRRASAYKDLSAFLKDLPPAYEVRNLAEIAQQFGVQLVKVTGGTSSDAPTVPTPAPKDRPHADNGVSTAEKVEGPTSEPVAPDGGASVAPASPVKRRTIKKVGPSRWRLYSHDGRNLGTFSSLQAAKDHERQVQAFKQRREDRDGKDAA